MFKGKEKWVVYTGILLGLVVLSVLIIRQLQYAYNLRMMYLQGDTGGRPVPDHQEIMLMNETFSKGFFLIFFCFWMILFGALILFTQVEKVQKQQKVENTHLFWRAVAPGITMILAGTLILAFALSRTQDTRLAYQKLIDPARQSLHTAASEEQIPLPDSSTKKAKSQKTARAPQEPEHAGAAIQPPRRAAAVPADTTANALPSARPLAGTPATSGLRKDGPVPEEVKQWADQLADRVIVFGYTPTAKEAGEYTAVYDRMKQDNDPAISRDLHWALQFVIKLQQGYDPTREEMKRYEKIAYEEAMKTVSSN